MKNIRTFIRKKSVFGGEIFKRFEHACFRNEHFPNDPIEIKNKNTVL